jgi:hypothetical protein
MTVDEAWYVIIGYAAGTVFTFLTCWILAGRGRGPWA